MGFDDLQELYQKRKIEFVGLSGVYMLEMAYNSLIFFLRKKLEMNGIPG